MNKRIIILPQKTSESLSLHNKKGGKGNDDIITVQNIKEINKSIIINIKI